jgi:protein-tyrosine phosphatase
MRTTFICLANSRKHGERCIAGVEIQPNPQTQQYQLVKNGSRPHWIRPVSNTNYGQVPTQWVERIHLLDVVNLENRGAVPRDCHQENILFEPNSIAIQTSLAPTFENLEALTAGAPMMLFGNRGSQQCQNN